MSAATQDRFRRILEAARKKDGGSNTDTMIVNSHLSQMKLFMLRQGLEFFPAQDTFGFRKQFVTQLIDENEIDTRLEGICDDFLIDGKGLFYFRPGRDTYRIRGVSSENYRAYYDTVGQREEDKLISSFTVREAMQATIATSDPDAPLRTGNTRVLTAEVEATITTEKPSFDAGAQSLSFAVNKTRTLTNSLGFVPAIEAFNNMRSTGMVATGEFYCLSE